MTKPRGKKIKMIRGEKLIYFLLIFLVICTPVISVFTKATVSESNIEAERLRKKISTQTRVNESLSMQINELASLDKIQAVANELGLIYNESNVKILADSE